MSDDEKFMKAALREAAKGAGHTSPNPAVGAVIVRDGKIIGRGWHRRAGEPHAEIEAIRALRKPDIARGATMYVTLEPCSTHGRTPPCCDAIAGHGFARVVVGAIDPNPKHAGRGLSLLRRAGIEVTTGVVEAECTSLNRAFNKWIVKGMPWVIAKAGMSLDGRLTRPPDEGQWITNERSRADAMKLRAQVDAILVGAETIRQDNPQLTIRGVRGFQDKQPWRVVLTRSNRLPRKARIFTDEYRSRTLIYRDRSLREVLKDLGRKGMTSVLIEGGGTVLGEAFDRRLVDEVHFYIAPLLCGGPDVIAGQGVGATEESILLLQPQYERLGDDILVAGLVQYPTKP
jgi:diaminohydroxyphosphoribosylaminopyrimidine deaminase / 5-amino-6-(5-phosphoribosylamino)uracil reductase